MSFARFGLFLLLLLSSAPLPSSAANWVRAGIQTNQPIWGAQGGLLFAIDPGGFRPREPRGLIRLGYPILPDGGYDLVNFIAIEPIVHGQKGFSELERSSSDRKPGKRIWAGQAKAMALDAGTVTQPVAGVEQLEVILRMEPFENGAHVRLQVTQRSDRPDEIAFRIQAEDDSAVPEYCILTATMGNMARTRLLWLKDQVVSSLTLYPNYKGDGFAPHTHYPLPQLNRTANGDVFVPITCDEPDPAAVFPFPNSPLWHYGGRKVTQYWKQTEAAVRDDLQAVVNGRYTYWMSQRPLPGGIAFENFELRERFYPGQTFIFGITPTTPRELGFKTP